jgi:hypothetical protein
MEMPYLGRSVVLLADLSHSIKRSLSCKAVEVARSVIKTGYVRLPEGYEG